MTLGNPNQNQDINEEETLNKLYDYTKAYHRTILKHRRVADHSISNQNFPDSHTKSPSDLPTCKNDNYINKVRVNNNE